MRRLLAVVRSPVVIDCEGRLEDLQVLNLVDVEQHAGIQHLRIEAVQILVLQALTDVIDSRTCELIPLLRNSRASGVVKSTLAMKKPEIPGQAGRRRGELRTTVRISHHNPRRLVTKAFD